MEVGNEDYLDWIYYSPVCKEWQKNRCLMLGIKFHSGNRDHGLKPSLIGVSQAPEKTGRIKGDGNCFFHAIAQIVTGDQDDHNEMRLILTTYMMNNSNLPKLSGIVVHESMDQYLKRTKMQNPKVWAMEVEIIATASLLCSTIYTFAPSGPKCQLLWYSPDTDMHQDESIYITNIHVANHFEPVKCM